MRSVIDYATVSDCPITAWCFGTLPCYQK